MTWSVGRPPNSQYYELCTWFKEIPTHDSMFRAVCVYPRPPYPSHVSRSVSCILLSGHFASFSSYICFNFFLSNKRKRQNSPRILFLCQHNLTHTNTLAAWWDSPIIFLARKTPSLNPPYYVFGKNCASPCSVTRFKVESLLINCRKLDIIIWLNA